MDIPKTVVARVPLEIKEEDKPQKGKLDRSKSFKMIFSICLMLVLPALMMFANTTGKSHDIRSKAAIVDNPRFDKEDIVYVPYTSTVDKNKEISIQSGADMQIRTGFIPKSQTSGENLFTASLVDSSGHKLSTTTFAPADTVAIDGKDPYTGREKAEVMQVVNNNGGISIPYNPSASYLAIQDNKGAIISMISLNTATKVNNIVYPQKVDTDSLNDLIEQIKRQNMLRLTITPIITPSPTLHPTIRRWPTFTPYPTLKPTITTRPAYIQNPTPEEPRERLEHEFNFIFPHNQVYAANGKFNIAIIGDNYGTNTALFQSDVQSIISGMLAIEPFTTNKANIAFYSQLSTVSICVPVTGWPSISCDNTKALQQASTVPYDKVYVLFNGPYTGYAYIGGVLAYGTNSTDKSSDVKQGLFIHELAGHALGGLMDEYSYGTTGTSYAPNCSSDQTCTSWSGIIGLGCFASCGYTNLYRATNNNSVMNTAFLSGIMNFDTYSTQIVNQKLYPFLQIVQPSATPTAIPTPTSTPLPTPTNTPTPTPTNTPTPTPTSTPTPAFTPTPLPSDTPVPVRLPISPGISAFPTSTPLPTPTNTPTPIPTSTPTPIPTNTPTSTPTQTPVPTDKPVLIDMQNIIPTDVQALSNCKFPNFCTQVKNCGESQTSDIACGISGQVCCRPIEKKEDIKPKDEEKIGDIKIDHFETIPTPAGQLYEENQIQPTPSATITPVIPTPTDLLNPEHPTQPADRIMSPTIRLYPENLPQPTYSSLNPTITSALPFQISSTPIPQRWPIFPTATSFIRPTPVQSNRNNIYPSITTSTPTIMVTRIRDTIYITPTPSVFNPDTFEFTRDTPTPQPKTSTLGNMNIFNTFFRGLFRSFLPNFFR